MLMNAQGFVIPEEIDGYVVAIMEMSHLVIKKYVA